MLRGYIRLSKAGPSLEDQQKALAQAGIVDFSAHGPVYVDNIPRSRAAPSFPQREYAIRSLVRGDRLVIACASRIGISSADILATLTAIAENGAQLCDAETGQTIEPTPEALQALRFAERAESDNRKETAAKMRQQRVATGRLGGAPEKLTGELLAEARELWKDHKFSVSQIAERTGISRRTLYRHLGERFSK